MALLKGDLPQDIESHINEDGEEVFYLEDHPDLAAVAEKHDRRTRKDATLNMRISSALLEEIKAAASADSYGKYQSWVTAVLEKAVATGL